MEVEALITGKLKKEAPCDEKPKTEEEFVEAAVDAKIDPSVFKSDETHEERFGGALISGTSGSMINHVLDRMNGNADGVFPDNELQIPAYSYKDEVKEILPDARPEKPCPES